MCDDTKWVIESMRVKTPSQETQIGTLSGGNQQKHEHHKNKYYKMGYGHSLFNSGKRRQR